MYNLKVNNFSVSKFPAIPANCSIKWQVEMTHIYMLHIFSASFFLFQENPYGTLTKHDMSPKSVYVTKPDVNGIHVKQ